MALSAARNQGMGAGGLVSVPGSCYSKWFTIHSDAKATASTGDEPRLITQTGAYWVNVPEGATRLDLRMGWTEAGTMGTPAQVTVWGCDERAEPGTDVPPADANYEQICDQIAMGATKILNVDPYDYGATNTTACADLRGAKSVLVQIYVAGASATAAFIQGRFLN